MGLKTMYPAMVNSPETVTLGAIDATAIQVSVQDITKIPEPPNLLVLGGERPDAETVLLTAISGTTITIERGVSGTARTWADRTTIARNFTSYDHDTFRENITALDGEKAVRATAPTAGHLAALTVTGDLTDSGTAPADFVPVVRKVNGKALSGDVTLTAADVNARPSTWLPTASEVGARPNSWTPTAADVGAVPVGRKVNGKALSADISLIAGDVGAATASHSHTPASIGAATAAQGNYTLTHSKSGNTHVLTGLGGATGLLSARFKATAVFVAGNGFTVDGTTYTAALASGDSLPDSAFVSGALVEVLLDTSARKLGFKAGGVPVGTLPSQSGLTATAGNGQVVLKVTRPNSSDYAGTLVVRKTGSTPTGPNDGTRLDLGTSTSYTNTGLSNGTTYYYRAFAYNSKKQYQTLITGATVSATPIVGIALSSHQMGDKIRVSVGGTYYNFIIVNQGRPGTMYDTSCDGTWLLMEQVYEKRQWNSSDVNDYANSTIKAYLDGTFYNKFESSVRSIIKQVKIPYRPGSGTSATVNTGSNGLSCKVFLLGGCELGWKTSDYMNGFPGDGAKLSYFVAGTTSDANAMRIANFNGTKAIYWMRSAHLDNSKTALYVRSDGDCSNSYCTVSYGIRPCIILPSTTMTKATANADGSYDLQL